jgi:hypothetical protein
MSLADSPQSSWQDKFYQITPYAVNASMWWQNPTNHNSLRLTQNAYLTMRKHVKFYKFKLLQEIRPKTFVQLERYFDEPYYVQNRSTIHIVSDRDAMMLGLMGSDLQTYLDNQSI